MSDTIGRLTLVGTPIGNLSDFSPRAIEALETCDFIAAEDTRVTLKLLNHFGITKPLVSYHEHNKRESGERVCARLLSGECGVLVSDAGMPGISDPGERLIAHCIEHDIPFEVLPGASASLTALITSGLPSREACFVGFLPRSGKERREAIARLARHRGSLIIYESPLRAAATAAELAEAWGDRQAVLLRELTKLYQEAVRSTLTGLAQTYAHKPPKGEVVLVIAGAEEQSGEAGLEETLSRLLSQGVSAKDAAKQASALLDVSRNEAYKMALELQGK